VRPAVFIFFHLVVLWLHARLWAPERRWRELTAFTVGWVVAVALTLFALAWGETCSLGQFLIDVTRPLDRLIGP